MEKKTIVFNGVSYDCRVVRSKDGEDLIIGSLELLDVLQPGNFNDENEGFASKEAEEIYNDIFFFTDSNTLKFPNEELIEELKDANPDWF